MVNWHAKETVFWLLLLFTKQVTLLKNFNKIRSEKCSLGLVTSVESPGHRIQCIGDKLAMGTKGKDK